MVHPAILHPVSGKRVHVTNSEMKRNAFQCISGKVCVSIYFRFNVKEITQRNTVIVMISHSDARTNRIVQKTVMVFIYDLMLQSGY